MRGARTGGPGGAATRGAARGCRGASTGLTRAGATLPGGAPGGVPTLAPPTKGPPPLRLHALRPPTRVPHPRGHANHPPGAFWDRGRRSGTRGSQNAPSSPAATSTPGRAARGVLRSGWGALPESPAKLHRGRLPAPLRSGDEQRPGLSRAPYGVHLRSEG
jgi:hypothetical protein